MTYAPYTHDEHAKATVVAYFKGQPLGIRPTHVQARIGRTVCCARIVTAWDTADGKEMWQVDLLGPIYGRMSVPSVNVRKCQAVDGRCTCVPHDVTPDAGLSGGGACDTAGQAGARSAPDGNHGETFPETAV